ncbi:unnamed protein product [Staurois parvus]|uniref:Uncharacterized protein n=1 Tax=Staurois parvus TaxID=386267 RepID=A0ABN9FFI4_9NEOB|nr:unnamed protein product [Staurois parvus]
MGPRAIGEHGPPVSLPIPKKAYEKANERFCVLSESAPHLQDIIEVYGKAQITRRKSAGALEAGAD